MHKAVKYFLDTIKSNDERRWAEKHPIERHSDREGNKGDVFGASNISMFDREEHRYGYNPGDDALVYESIEHPELNDFINDALVLERTLSPAELEKREEYVKKMKRSKGDFKKRYGKDWKGVMYATATKMAKEDVDSIPTSIIEAAVTDAQSRYNAYCKEAMHMCEMICDLIDSHKDRAENHVSPFNSKDRGPTWGHVYDIREIHNRLGNIVDSLGQHEESEKKASKAFDQPAVQEDIERKLSKLLSETVVPLTDTKMFKLAHRLVAKFPIEVVETISKRIHDPEDHNRLMMMVNDIKNTKDTKVDLGGELITEKYIGFKKLAKKVGGRLAAWIGRKKYGKKKFQKAAAEDKSLRKEEPKYSGTKKESFDVFDQLRLAIINETEQEVTFADGSKEIIDAETAQSIFNAYEALNDENKEKMQSLMTESAEGFIKALEFAASLVESSDPKGPFKCPQHGQVFKDRKSFEDHYEREHAHDNNVITRNKSEEE